MSAPERNLRSLPVWARDRIERLEAEVARLKADRNRGPDETDTFIDHLGDHTAGPEVQYQPLRPGAIVTFWPGEGYPQPARGRLTAQWVAYGGPGTRAGHLEVSGSGLSAALQVMPWATNVVRITEAPLR